MLLDDHLVIEDILSDLFPVSTVVRSFAHHEFVYNNTNSKKIGSESVRHFTENFRRHIPRCAARFKLKWEAAWGLDFSNTEISQSSISSLFENDVLRFDIAMNDTFLMDILETDNETGDNEL